MIPESEILEATYDRAEVLALEALRTVVSRVNDANKAIEVGRQGLRAIWPDEIEYISKTHWIRTKSGECLLLKPNYAQVRFYEECIVSCRREKRPIRAIILKARQLGFSTFIQSWQYEQCERDRLRYSLTLSYDDTSTEELFGKAKFVHDHQYFARKTKRDRSNVLEFTDTKSAFFAITAGNTSAGRGNTYQHMHCSEIPMWADAGETLGAAVQAVPAKPGTSIIYESTARGAVGQFYDDWRAAESGASDFIPFFAPWFWDPEYVLEFASPDHEAAFGRSLSITERRLQDNHRLTLQQLHWRRYKIRNELQGSEAKFRQEFPSTADEAFLTSGTPVFNADAIAQLEKNAATPLWVGNIHLEI